MDLTRPRAMYIHVYGVYVSRKTRRFRNSGEGGVGEKKREEERDARGVRISDPGRFVKTVDRRRWGAAVAAADAREITIAGGRADGCN